MYQMVISTNLVSSTRYGRRFLREARVSGRGRVPQRFLTTKISPILSESLLALQLLQFKVDRAQTPLTGDVLPPPHHARAPQAAGRVLQVGEPPMDGVQHRGTPSPLSGSPGGIGNCTEKTTHLCSNKRTLVGFALSRTAGCSPSAHHQITSGGRCLSAIFHEVDNAHLYPVAVGMTRPLFMSPWQAPLPHPWGTRCVPPHSNGHPLWGGRLHDWLCQWRQLLCVPTSYGALSREPWLLLTTWSLS